MAEATCKQQGTGEKVELQLRRLSMLLQKHRFAENMTTGTKVKMSRSCRMINVAVQRNTDDANKQVTHRNGRVGALSTTFISHFPSFAVNQSVNRHTQGRQNSQNVPSNQGGTGNTQL